MVKKACQISLRDWPKTKQVLFANLQTLYCGNNRNFTDNGLKGLSNIATRLAKNKTSFVLFAHLQTLECVANKNFTDDGIKNLPYLQRLHCKNNNNFTDEVIKVIPNVCFW